MTASERPGRDPRPSEAFTTTADTILPFERAGVRVTVRRALEQADAIAHRFLTDALTSSLACQWRGRADVLEWCRPRPTDYTGRATAAELAARDARLAADAARCRSHARLLEEGAGADLRAELAAMLAAEGVA
ncbi:MAG: hypothetical protein KDB60_07550 [Propionibacteriaceae bacterium]|nr:hypothetical protein [Propionibacteriaceae bacterium]